MKNYTLGQLIRSYREKKGLTQEELADIIHVTKGKLTHWENDETIPRPTMVARLIGAWINSDYVFTGEYGGPMAPDTLSGYLQRFEKKYNLPHIHAHKFRHSMASILYFSGADPVSISKRLGHAQVSTTQDMYAHLIRQADTQSAERIANAIFRSDIKRG